MKIHYIILILLNLFVFSLKAQVGNPDQKTISGKIVDSETRPIEKATVKLGTSANVVTTDQTGVFNIRIPIGNQSLNVTAIGYKSKAVNIDADFSGELQIVLEDSISALKEITISTGYQNLPRERATGSFVQVDQTLLNRRIGTDILSRLEDIAPGLIFNRDFNSGSNARTKLSIRGQSTINGSVDPLIILNNFPFEGDIRDINPNDVESITLLKDAAAASIWGTKAGNGVIVITTKKGIYDQRARIALNANVTIGNKPDLFYQPQMSTGDFIEIEKKLFSEKYYEGMELSGFHTALSPVVDLLIAGRDNLIDPVVAQAKIEDLKKLDLRNDLEKYFYQKSISQQYALNLTGGNEGQKYFLSAGFDKNRDNLVRNGYNRTTINGNNTYSFLKQRLEITSGINFTQNKTLLNNAGYISSAPYYPYTQFADDQGNLLSVNKDFSTAYLKSVSDQGLLDWTYNPVEELGLADNWVKQTNYRLNTSVNYKLSEAFQATVLYQYGNLSAIGENLQNRQSYFARNLINSYTQSVGGILSYPVPLGGILDRTQSSTVSHNLRAQLNYNKSWNGLHQLTAIAGYEISELRSTSNQSRLYGYDDEHAISTPVDYINEFPQFFYPDFRRTITNSDSRTVLTDRSLSYYANAGYTYRGRYTLSASARLDRSNIFGVRTNQKGVPLWSAGAAWNIDQESFCRLDWLEQLKLRATYGYSGNVYKNISAYITASYRPAAPNTYLPYAIISNPPNPALRWERIQMFNLGLDFSTKNSVISGTVEYYQKKGIDLIGLITTSPQTGISSFMGNNASTTGSGIDLSLNSRNINREFKWNSAFFLSYNKEEVSRYNVPSSAINYVYSPGLPLEGKPLFSIYSFASAGLDPATGNPQGYLNGEVSQDYGQIINNVKPADLVFNGPAKPTLFGAFRNEVSWKGFSMSANISYRLGYYFRKNSINFAGAMTAQGGHGDYAYRWQKPGDEKITLVPSVQSTLDYNRDNLYLYGSTLVEKGDHIRLQDISLGYDLPKSLAAKAGATGLKIYVYANNLGLIWTANRYNIDPDYQTGQTPFSIAAGIKVDF